MIGNGVFNGYVQHAAGQIKNMNNLAGLGIVIQGNSVSLNTSTTLTGTITLYRDDDASSTIGIITNTEKIENVSAGLIQVVAVTPNGIVLKFNNFPVSRKRNAGMSNQETFNLNGTLEFINVRHY